MSKFETVNLGNIANSGAAAALVGAVGGMGDILINGANTGVAGNLTSLAAATGIAGIALLGGANQKPELTVAGAMGGVASVFALAAGLALHNPAPAGKAAAPTMDHAPALHTSPPPVVKTGVVLRLSPPNP